MPEEDKQVSPFSTDDYPSKRKAMNMAILAISLTAIGDMLFLNGFVLMLLSVLKVPSGNILLYLSLPALAQMLLLIPAAHYARRIGIKSGVIGGILNGLSLLCLFSAPYCHPYGLAWLPLLVGMLLEGVGSAMHVAVWYPLTSGFVPESERGNFFGRMRFSYQLVSIIFTFFVIAVLKNEPSPGAFQLFLILAFVTKIIGVIFYSRLPQQGCAPGIARKMFHSLLHAIGAPGYMPFCAYVFLLSLATGCCMSLFCLLAKGPLSISEDEVILIGNLGMAGALAGYFFGGRMVDRIGTKAVFLICHFAFGAILLSFTGRVFFPAAGLLLVGGLNFTFGMVQAASGIAMSSEMLALIPSDNKPMATALNQVLLNLGISLSGIFSAQAIRFGVLNNEWNFCGAIMTQYDTLIIVCGLSVLLLTVTLGLVPSVVKKVQWSSGNSSGIAN